jgi:hypothetical protein
MRARIRKIGQDGVKGMMYNMRMVDDVDNCDMRLNPLQNRVLEVSLGS